MEKIGKFYDVISGYAFKSKDLKDTADVPVVKIGNISNGRNIVRENLQYVSRDLLKINKKYHMVSSKNQFLRMIATPYV